MSDVHDHAILLSAGAVKTQPVNCNSEASHKIVHFSSAPPRSGAVPYKNGKNGKSEAKAEVKACQKDHESSHHISDTLNEDVKFKTVAERDIEELDQVLNSKLMICSEQSKPKPDISDVGENNNAQKTVIDTKDAKSETKTEFQKSETLAENTSDILEPESATETTSEFGNCKKTIGKESSVLFPCKVTEPVSESLLKLEDCDKAFVAERKSVSWVLMFAEEREIPAFTVQKFTPVRHCTPLSILETAEVTVHEPYSPKLAELNLNRDIIKNDSVNQNWDSMSNDVCSRAQSETEKTTNGSESYDMVTAL